MIKLQITYVKEYIYMYVCECVYFSQYGTFKKPYSYCQSIKDYFKNFKIETCFLIDSLTLIQLS